MPPKKKKETAAAAVSKDDVSTNLMSNNFHAVKSMTTLGGKLCAAAPSPRRATTSDFTPVAMLDSVGIDHDELT